MPSLDAQDLQVIICARGLFCNALSVEARGRIWNVLSQREYQAPTGRGLDNMAGSNAQLCVT